MEKKREADVAIRPAGPEDFDRILELNEESVHFLSPLTREKLEHLDNQAELHKVAVAEGEVVAFCLAFREGADYDSVNYRWFADHYSSFLYVDRVVVDLKKQGLGLGSPPMKSVPLCQGNRRALVTAEIDIEPPNPVSLKFHEKFGFHEVGRQEVVNGTKIVSLQIAKP